MLAAITAAFTAFPAFVTAIQSLVSAYQTHVKLLWAQSLQQGLGPLEQGQQTTDAEKAAAAKAVADAIAKMS